MAEPPKKKFKLDVDTRNKKQHENHVQKQQIEIEVSGEKKLIKAKEIPGVVTIKKPKGSYWATFVFDSEEHMEAAKPLLLSVNASNPRQCWEIGKKQASFDARKRLRENDDAPRKTIEDSVTPLHQTDYEHQLVMKNRKLRHALQNITKATVKSYRSTNKDQPAWLKNVQSDKSDNKPICCPLQPTIPSPQTEGYRNNCSFTVGFDTEGKPCVGFLLGAYKEGFATVARPYNCKNVAPIAKHFCYIFQSVLDATADQLPCYDKVEHVGFWRRLIVRHTVNNDVMVLIQIRPLGTSTEDDATRTPADYEKSFSPPEGEGIGDGVHFAVQKLLAAFRAHIDSTQTTKTEDVKLEVVKTEPETPAKVETTTAMQTEDGSSKPEQKPELITTSPYLAEVKGGINLKSLQVQLYCGISNAAPSTVPHRVIYGGDHILEEVNGLRFRVSATSFFQVNTPGNEQLIKVIKEMANLTPDTILLDLCCGTGSIGICLAQYVKQVIGVEIVADAIEDAKWNAKENNISNCTYVCNKVEAPEVLQMLEGIVNENKAAPIVCVLDPPRCGMNPAVIKWLRRTTVLQDLVFVSCDPNGLVANADSLTRAQSNTWVGRAFQPVQAQALDLFPHTDHVESIVSWKRESGDNH
eukprot:TRINITY_DN55040_c0_g1_i1.p1 TRINITY_DN55040_c0_g1~~TRINITY_DN55040_c0_g1_i1.p1  ORF type:complete len:651 (+),score=60.49 TRINITY_DN55040_c0_g1_i1:43-1953(+)